MVFFDQNAVAGEWRAQMRCCEERASLFIAVLLSPWRLQNYSNCRTPFRSCRPSRPLCLYPSASEILRASLT